MSAIVQGSVAVITGAAGGIGLGLARQAAKRGLRVVLSDIRRDALEQAARELSAQGTEVLAIPADVTREADMQSLAEEATKRFGKVKLMSSSLRR